MPRHPIYIDMLPETAREVIGKVHPSTAPARALLESEGFFNRGYVDIFDGGPTIEARISNLRVVRDSQVALVELDDGVPEADPILVATREAEAIRVTVVDRYAVADHQAISLSSQAAELLGVGDGDQVRIATFRAGPVL
jgi:arginine N-succinyltransferase